MISQKQLSAIRKVLRSSEIEKAWLFGSFSRNEERGDSDIDLLVEFRKGARIGLIYYSCLILSLEKATGKKVDLAEAGQLIPSAQITADKDKILIYERSA